MQTAHDALAVPGLEMAAPGGQTEHALMEMLPEKGVRTPDGQEVQVRGRPTDDQEPFSDDRDNSNGLPKKPCAHFHK